MSTKIARRARAHLSSRIAGLVAGVALFGAPSGASALDTLWFGNDNGGVDYHTTTTGVVLGAVREQLTGAAWDGHTLYLSQCCTGGVVEKWNLAGTSTSGSFTVPFHSTFSEDMAWDSKRNTTPRSE